MISLISLAMLASANASANALDIAALTPTPTATAPADAPLAADALQNPAPPTAPPEPKWTGSVTAGAIVTTGNSQTRNANATADAVYQRVKDRITLGFLWSYADNKNTPGAGWTLTDRKTSGRAKYDYFLSEKTYALAQASAEADELADLDLRTTLGVGAGRQFADDEEWKFSAEGGLAHIDENHGSSPDDSYIAARAAYNATWNLSKMWSFGQLVELYPSLESLDDFNAHVDTRAKATLTGSLFGQVQWVYDFDNTPAAGHDRVDNRLILTLGWKF